VLLRRLAPALVAALVIVPAAHADADPASDVLYTQRIYLPFFGGRVSPDRAEALRRAVEAAWAKGFKIKVALIPGEQDLGGVYQLFGKPQTYADFLGRELVFLYKGLLITVMPQGLGVYQYERSVKREQAVLNEVSVPSGADGLAEAAIVAVGKLAGLRTHQYLVPAKKSSSGTPVWALALIAAGGAALLAAMVVLGPRVVRRRA
jgi:hypothetical protein